MAHVIGVLPKHVREGLLQSVDLFSSKNPKLYSKVAINTFDDNQSYSEFASITDLSMAPAVTETNGVTFDNVYSPYSKQVSVVMRAIGVAISEQATATDLYREVAKYPKKLAMALDKTKEQVVANVLNNAFSTAGVYNGWDSVAMCSASHPSETGLQSNTPSNVVPLSILGLEQGINELNATKSHKGDPQPVMGPFYLYVPPALGMLAERLVASSTQPQTANRESNVAGPRVEVVVHPYLTSTTAWWLQDKEEGKIFLLNRIKRRVRDSYDPDHLVNKVVIFEEYAAGNTDWRGIWGDEGV